MNGKKLIGLVAAAVAIFYVLTDPSDAASAVQVLFGWFKDGAAAIITFVKGIFK